MAQKVSVTVLDDMDGSEGAETVTFGFDDQVFEIDLNAKHAAEIQAVFTEFTGAARRVSSAALRRPVRGGRARRSGDPKRSAEIRLWAAQSGVEVSERGRIPEAVVKQFDEAKGVPVAKFSSPEPEAPRTRRSREKVPVA